MLGVRPTIFRSSRCSQCCRWLPPAALTSRAPPRNAGASDRDAWIGAEADRLSGRSLTVTCADTQAEWGQELGLAGFPAAEADQYYGFSLIEQGELHLSPYVCAGLQLGARRQRRGARTSFRSAWSVDVLVHESVHMARFTSDEALTEACARVGLPLELHRLYHLAYGSAELRRLTAAATLFRQTMGAGVSARRLYAAYARIVTGSPGAILSTSQVIDAVSSRMQPCETAVPGHAADVGEAVQRDLPRAALELLKDVRAGAQARARTARRPDPPSARAPPRRRTGLAASGSTVCRRRRRRCAPTDRRR